MTEAAPSVLVSARSPAGVTTVPSVSALLPGTGSEVVAVTVAVSV